jgi:chemosensory pili system protein ChpA (sensor histidine kinase/response regulator)
LRETLGEEIFEIFTEEVAEIVQNLSELYPQWDKQRQDRELLTELRRAFHTLKGSGRMAGAFALGDFGWAHENLLNLVLSGQQPMDDRLSAVLGNAVQELQERQSFFQTAQQKDARVDASIAAVDALLMPEREPALWEVHDDDLPEVVFEDAKPLPVMPEPEPEPFIEPLQEESDATEPEPFLESLLDETETVAPESVFEPLDEEPESAEPEQTPEPQPVQEVDEAPTPQIVHQEADNQMVWQFFWEEFPDQMQALDQHLHHLREHSSDQETIRELEREFHTLKGGARMAQLFALADVSHEAEHLLSRIPVTGTVGSDMLDALQQAVDRLHSLAEQARYTPVPVTDIPATPTVEQVVDETDETPPARPAAPSLAEAWAKRRTGQGEFSSMLEKVLAEQAESLPDISVLGVQAEADAAAGVTVTPAQVSHETIRLPASFVDKLIDRVVGLNVQQVRLAEHFNSMGVDVNELVSTVARLRQQVRSLELESEAQIHDGRSARGNSTVQRSGEAFDALEMDQYAEIQRISRSLAESLNDLVNLESDLSSQLRKGEQLLHEDMRTTRTIRQDLLDTRLVALTMLVPRLRRLVRQTATELDKQVVLEVEGEECELDRNLLQHLTAPLEHLIRNAISHGIESPDERERLGKARSGRITLSVSRDDAEIVIRFRDDGRGLDRNQLRQTGAALGMIASDDKLPDSELDRLILRSGFTTAATVNQIAGRGIGMDVVYSELKALGGNLQISSQPGQGVEFSMRLPFTLVVNPVLLVDVEGQMFALPIGGIQGLARLSGADINKALENDGTPIEYAGETYHLQALAEQLGSGNVPVFAGEEMFPVVFFRLNGQAVAWIISHIHGRREVVLQPLGILFRDCRLYSAATVSSDGRVLLVPDLAELAQRAGADTVAPPVQGGAEGSVESVRAEDGSLRVLVVDDSITVRRVTEKFLGAQEYAVATAKDGMDALQQIGDFLPDVLLLDIEMPRMDGFELLGHLRNDPQWQRLPIIMISSRTAQRHRDHAMALGATAFLGKPYQNEILLSTLNSVLEHGHVNDGERISA